MRLQALFGTLISFATLVLAISIVTDEPVEPTEPEILVSAAFPEENAFGHVVNGERNAMTLTVENKSDRNITLVGVTGSIHHPDTDALVKNLTTLQYGVPLPEGVKLQLPYTFFSEFKPGDLRLSIWLEHSVDDVKYRVSAYDSIVTIVEPPISIFDFKLLSTYLVVAAFLGGLGYVGYLSFVPAPKKTRSKPAPSDVSDPVGSVTATGAGGYQEEWIPDHHLRKTKSGKKQSGVGAVSGTSGDELSGAEVSGAEGKRRKGKK